MVVLDQRPASIGSLSMNPGVLQLREHLTLNQPSALHDLTIEAPRGRLTVNADTAINGQLDWITGTVGGTSPLTVSNLTVTHATSVRLETGLTLKGTGVMEQTTLAIANAAFRPEGRLVLRSGTITNAEGTSLVQSSALVRKEGSGDFTVRVPLQAYERLLRIPPRGIEAADGRLSLLAGGSFRGFQTNTVQSGGTLELAGPFEVRGEATRFQGDGTLALGTLEADLRLEIFPLAKLLFGLGGNTAVFRRGKSPETWDTL